MNFWRLAAEIFAFSILFFVSAVMVHSQELSSIYRLQSGTVIRVQMDNEINSKSFSVNDTFTTVVAAPVIVSESIVLPIGTVIEGRITTVKKAAFGGRNGRLNVIFEKITMPGGAKRNIEAVLTTERAIKSSRFSNFLPVIGGTLIGGILGSVSGTGSRILTGAGIGAAGGTAFSLIKKGTDIKINADEEFEIILIKDVTLPVDSF